MIYNAQARIGVILLSEHLGLIWLSYALRHQTMSQCENSNSQSSYILYFCSNRIHCTNKGHCTYQMGSTCVRETYCIEESKIKQCH